MMAHCLRVRSPRFDETFVSLEMHYEMPHAIFIYILWAGMRQFNFNACLGNAMQWNNQVTMTYS